MTASIEASPMFVPPCRSISPQTTSIFSCPCARTFALMNGKISRLMSIAYTFPAGTYFAAASVYAPEPAPRSAMCQSSRIRRCLSVSSGLRNIRTLYRTMALSCKENSGKKLGQEPAPYLNMRYRKFLSPRIHAQYLPLAVVSGNYFYFTGGDFEKLRNRFTHANICHIALRILANRNFKMVFGCSDDGFFSRPCRYFYFYVHGVLYGLHQKHVCPAGMSERNSCRKYKNIAFFEEFFLEKHLF